MAHDNTNNDDLTPDDGTSGSPLGDSARSYPGDTNSSGSRHYEASSIEELREKALSDAASPEEREAIQEFLEEVNDVSDDVDESPFAEESLDDDGLDGIFGEEEEEAAELHRSEAAEADGKKGGDSDTGENENKKGTPASKKGEKRDAPQKSPQDESQNDSPGKGGTKEKSPSDNKDNQVEELDGTNSPDDGKVSGRGDNPEAPNNKGKNDGLTSPFSQEPDNQVANHDSAERKGFDTAHNPGKKGTSGAKGKNSIDGESSVSNQGENHSGDTGSKGGVKPGIASPFGKSISEAKSVRSNKIANSSKSTPQNSSQGVSEGMASPFAGDGLTNFSGESSGNSSASAKSGQEGSQGSSQGGGTPSPFDLSGEGGEEASTASPVGKGNTASDHSADNMGGGSTPFASPGKGDISGVRNATPPKAHAGTATSAPAASPSGMLGMFSGGGSLSPKSIAAIIGVVAIVALAAPLMLVAGVSTSVTASSAGGIAGGSEESKCAGDGDGEDSGSKGKGDGIAATGESIIPMSGIITAVYYKPSETEYLQEGGHGSAGHNGVDIAAPMNEPIYSAFSGTVIAAGEASGYGYWVVIQSEEDPDIYATYGHIQAYHVKTGDDVKVGDHIADEGNRGQSTGPHLHFQLDKGGYGGTGEPINPHTWMKDNGLVDSDDRHEIWQSKLEAGDGSGGKPGSSSSSSKDKESGKSSDKDKSKDKDRGKDKSKDNGKDKDKRGDSGKSDDKDRDKDKGGKSGKSGDEDKGGKSGKSSDSDSGNYSDEKGAKTLIVGDSITVGSTPIYHEGSSISGHHVKQDKAPGGKGLMPEMSIDAYGGKAFNWAYDTLKGYYKDFGSKYDTLVIFSAVNGDIDKGNLDEVIKKAHDADMKVILVNGNFVFEKGGAEGKEDTYKAIKEKNNKIIEDADYDILVDWASEVDDRGESIMNDFVHPNGEGQKVLTKLIQEAVSKAKDGQTGTVGGDGSTTGGGKKDSEGSGNPCVCSNEEKKKIDSDVVGNNPTGGMEEFVEKYAPIIVAVGEYLDLSDEDILLALGTPIGESTYRNIANPGTPESLEYPHDLVSRASDPSQSLGNIMGLYQQTIPHWGEVGDVMQPVYAAAAFYGEVMMYNRTNPTLGAGVGDGRAWKDVHEFAWRVQYIQRAKPEYSVPLYTDTEPQAKAIFDEYRDKPADLSAEDEKLIDKAVALRNKGGGGESSDSSSGDSSSSGSKSKKDRNCGAQKAKGKKGKGDGGEYAEAIDESDAGETAKEAVKIALDQRGKPYVWAAVGPDTFDCSGLISYAYIQAGFKNINGNGRLFATSSIGDVAEKISEDMDDLVVGDAIISNGGAHVVLYIGDGKVVHAPTSGDVVKVSDIPSDAISVWRFVDSDDKAMVDGMKE